MQKIKAIIITIIFLINFKVESSVPISPNQYDQNKLKTGHWTLTYDSLFRPTQNLDSIYYYRIARFEAGKPIGKVRDFYITGQKQWEGFLSSNEPEIKEGECTFYYENGKVSSISNFIHNKMNGLSTNYYLNGKISSVGTVKNDSNDGVWHWYYESGNLNGRTTFSNNKVNGLLEIFYENGKLKSKGTKINGLLDGQSVNYYENGNVELIQNFINDNLHGKYEKYYETGNLKVKGLYENNNQIGIWEYFYENGKLEAKGKNNEKGLKQGIWNYYDENGVLNTTEYLEDEVPNGVFSSFYPSGKLKSKGIYKNGLRDSIWNYYHENGKLSKNGSILKDSLVGVWKYFYENGLLKSTGLYVDNKKNDTWNYYYENGNLDATEHLKMGTLDGIYKEYYEKGGLKAEFSYKNGLKNGLYTEYYLNGNIFSQGKYVDGNKHEIWKDWHKNGVLSAFCNYNMGRRDGSWKWYYDNGQISDDYFYKNENYDGKYTEYYENGNKKIEGKYKNGQKTDFHTYYSRDGSVYSQGICMNNYRTGKWIFNDSITKKISSKGEYLNGNFDGKWIFYDSLGKYKSTTYYRNGFLENINNISDSIDILTKNEKYSEALIAIEWLNKVIKRNNKLKTVIEATPYYHYGSIYYRKNEFNKSLENYKKYAELTKKYDSDTAHNYSTALNGIAINLIKLNKITEALTYYNKVLDILNKTNKRFGNSYTTVFTNKANLYISINQKDTTEKLLFKELEIRENKFGINSDKTYPLLKSLSEFYEEQMEYEKSLIYLKKLNNKVDTLRDKYEEYYIDSKTGQILCYENIGKNKEALNQQKELIGHFLNTKKDNTLKFFDNVNNLAIIYGRLNLTDSSKIFYDYVVAATNKNEWQNTSVAMEAKYGLAVYYSNNFQYNKSIEFYPEVLSYFKKNNNKSNLYASILYGYGYTMYKCDNSKIKESIAYTKEYVALKKSIFGPSHIQYIEALLNLSKTYRNDLDYKNAEAVLDTAQTIMNNHYSTENVINGKIITDKAYLKYCQNLSNQSLHLYKQALNFYLQKLPEYFDDYIECISKISNQFNALSKTDSAIYYSKKAMELYKKEKNETDDTYINLSTSYAFDLTKLGLFNDAEKIYLKALNQTEKNSGKESLKYVYILNDMGYFYDEKNDIKKQKKYYAEAKNISISISNETNENTFIAQKGILSALVKEENYTEAEKLCNYLLKITKEKYGDQSLDYALFLKKMGNVLKNQRKWSESESYYLKSIKILKSIYGNDAKEVADAQFEYAKVTYALGKFKETEALHNSNILIYANRNGKSSWSYINSLTNLSDFYLEMGQYIECEKYMLEQIELSNKKENKYNTAIFYSNYAKLLNQWKKYAKADSIANNALVLFEDILERNHPKIINTKNLIGLIALNQLKIDKAYTNFQFCIDETKLKNDSTSFAYGAYLNNQSMVWIEKDNYQKAENLLKHSSKIFSKTTDKSFNDVFHLDNYSTLYQAWNKPELAEKYWLLVCKKSLAYIETNFYFMSDNEKAQFWAKNNADFEYFNTFATLRAAQNPSIIGEMYNNQLATKGILLSTSNKIKNRILNSQDTSLIQDYQKWIKIKEDLAKTYLLTEEEKKSKNIIITDLEKQSNTLEKNLNITSQDIENEKLNTKINWKDVQKLLGPDEAAIEIIRYRYYNKHLTDSVLYAALILTQETKISPKLVVLSQGLALENQYLKYYKNTIKYGLEESNSYENYWKPIENLIPSKSKIYISLDGVYNSINLNTLQNSKGEYLIDSKNIKIISNTKDIIAIKSKLIKTTSKSTASLFGFPTYFVGDKKPINVPNSERAINNVDRSGIAALPGTKVEIEKISSILETASWQSQNYIGENASEKSLKSINNPKLLHIATHGIFIDNENSSDSKNSVINRIKSLQNPLLKVGLLLTGAANYFQNEHLFSEENGILTAYEASNLNLENTDMVILSACETGKGQIINGEGVYGLQRAFQTAGSKAVMMSLWKVNDTATQELMTAFYSKWLNGMDKMLAFKNAQLEIKQKYKNPYYWGSFVLVGN